MAAGAAKVALDAEFRGMVSLAGFKLRLAVVAGAVWLEAELGRFFSTSRWAISVSICDLNSFEARRSSARSRPACRAISGSFLGPKMIRANKNKKIVSEKLIASS